MKKLILLVAVLIIGCKSSIPKHKALYKEGEIVYIKPDSSLATIVSVDDGCFCGNINHGYLVNYFDKNKVMHSQKVSEYEIFGRK